MIQEQWFSLLGTPFTITFGILLVLITGIFSWITLLRTNFSKWMVFLELLRMLMVGMVAFTINQPEWLQQFMPEQDPVLVVLWDESGSMETQDVIDDGSMDAKTRREWIQPMLESAIWEPFEEKVEVVIEPFSSDLKNPSKGSDLNAALDKVLEKYKNLRGVVMFTDGSWNYGESPTIAATRLRMKEIPSFTVAVGSESPLPDIEILSLDAPSVGVARKPTRIPFSIKSTMARDVASNCFIDIVGRAMK